MVNPFFERFWRRRAELLKRFGPIESDVGKADFDKVEFRKVNGRQYPYCTEHGAMNKVARHSDGGGLWRCVTDPYSQCSAGCQEKGRQV